MLPDFGTCPMYSVPYHPKLQLKSSRPLPVLTLSFTFLQDNKPNNHIIMAAAESAIIYAELLSNIRQISVIASLPSPVDATTRAELSADSSKIRVYHGTSSQEARLPGQVSAPSVLPIQTKPGAPTSLSWRLPVLSHAPRLVVHQGTNPVVPWTASNLVPRAPLSCRRCNQILVMEGKLSVWKDLPSENWAEMMDFWHCHKPHDHGNGNEHDHHHHHHGHDHGQLRSQNAQSEEHLAQRAYGANSSIAAQTATGFVDLTSFLLAENDCSGLNVSFRVPLFVKHSFLRLVRDVSHS